MLRILSIICAVALTSCGLYSKFDNTVDSKVVDDLFDYTAVERDTTSIASLEWRALFTDPKLQLLIARGLDNNTDLRLAHLNVEQAEVVLRVARLNYAPTLDLEADSSVSKQGSTKTSDYSITAEASWEIDIFGKVRNAKEQSKAALEQSRAYQQAVQTSLISTIANSYYSLLLLDEQLSISRQTLVNWDENIRAMEALKRAGRLNTTSVLQSQASRVALAREIVTYEQQIAAVENALSVLLCESPQHIDRGGFAEAEFPETLSIGVPLQMVANRPDVRVAEYALAQAFYATGEARSSLYPSFTLEGSLGFVSGGTTITTPADLLMSVVGSIVQPIFNRGTLRGQLKVSKMQQEQALLNFNQAILDAGAEVNTALISWQSARDRLAYDVEQMDLLERALLSAELLMRHGNSNYLEVLAAQLSLLQSQINYASNRFAEIQGVIDLYRSLGGGSEPQ
ncbi:MAG: TolC family protein [Rikenellaceae bacterium]